MSIGNTLVHLDTVGLISADWIYLTSFSARVDLITMGRIVRIVIIVTIVLWMWMRNLFNILTIWMMFRSVELLIIVWILL